MADLIILFAQHQLWKSQKCWKTWRRCVCVHYIILWCIKSCCWSSTVFAYSNSCFDRYVLFKVHSVNSGYIRAVEMSLTSGETQHFLAVAAQCHAMLPKKFNFFNFKRWNDEAMNATLHDSRCVCWEICVAWSDIVCNRVFTLILCVFLWHSSPSLLLVWTHL